MTRHLSKVGTAAWLRITAAASGWERDPKLLHENGSPRVRWHRSDGEEFLSGVPELMPPAMRMATRALLSSWLGAGCACCGVAEVPFDDEALAAADMERTQLSPITGGASGITHATDCPLRPLAMAGRVVNTVGTEHLGAELN